MENAHKIMNSYKARCSGFTLLEILIAVVILSVGLLALASLQTRGLATGHNAYLRSQAVLLTRDMAERIRANSNYAFQAINNGYIINFGGATTPQDCVTNPCTPAQIASYDLNQWVNTLTQALPQGSGQVVRDTTNPLQYNISVQWNTNQRNTPGDQNPGNNPALQSLKTYTLEVI